MFYEKIVTEIREELTSPRFSPRRDKDINKLVKFIKKKIRLDNEHELIKNESEALKFTLIKYVNVEKLLDGLNEMNSGIIDYYTNTNVSFSNGSKINFSLEDEKIYKQISNRIYKTRNAVIHSKSDEKERYMPFKHEGQLLKEIPLLQIIAEEIIISTSEML